MKLKMKLILLCYVAIFVTCNPTNLFGNNQLVGGLNGTEISGKYRFDRKLYKSGAFANVYVGHTKDEPTIKVAMKLENKYFRDEKATNEIKIYQRLHEKYDDLVQCHLLNMLDFGKYKDKVDAIILTRAGVTLMEAVLSKKLEKTPGNWPKICRVMTQVIDAVQHLHRADIVHLDIKDDNVLYGLEPVPVNGSRLPGVTYENDVYLLDLGNSEILKQVKNAAGFGRFEDLISIGRLFCSILIEELFQPSKQVHQLSDIKTYFDTEHPFNKFSIEMRTALIGYHQEIKVLGNRKPKLTEEQLKTAINYDKLRGYFK